MRLWLDDARPAPANYRHVYLVDEAITHIMRSENEIGYLWRELILGRISRERFDQFIKIYTIEVISCDNDLGEGNAEGYKLLDWLEATGRNYPIHIHSANPVAVKRMRAIIERNGWKEIK